MRVLFVFRKQTSIRFSLESVFHSIGESLRSQNIKIEYLYINKLSDLLKIYKKKYDVIHVTGDINYLIPILPRCKRILSIHDIGHYLNLKGLKKLLYRFLWFDLPIIFSNKVVFSSEATYKNALNHNFYLKQSTIIPLTSENLFFELGLKKNFSSELKFLHIGTQKHKNLECSMNIVSWMKKPLTVIGHPSISDYDHAASVNVDLKVFSGISKSELYSILENHDVLLFPSFHEGFGLPIIEAQAAGLIVITSNIEPMIQVAGHDSAIFINPHDSQKYSNQIMKMLNDRIELGKLQKRGYENSKKYDASKIAQSYLKLYEKSIK